MSCKVAMKCVATAVALTSVSGAPQAGALYFYEMSSVTESSYAGAGMVARANDAGTTFSNPAGMTRFDKSEIMAGGTGVYINAQFDLKSSEQDGTSKGVNKTVVPAGSFDYIHPVSDRLVLGVHLGNYFGLAVDWKDDWVARYTSVDIAVLAPQLQPTVAYRVNDWLSVGAGAALTLGYMQDKMRVESIPPGGKDGKLRISDADFAVQGNFGVMITPWEHTRIGLRYLTETDLDFDDAPNISGVSLPDLDPSVDFTSPSDAIDIGLKMPQEIMAGIHHQWNDKLAILGSAGWAEFSEFGKVKVGLDGVRGISTTVDADFRDVYSGGVGAEYKYGPDLELTAGFMFDSSMSSTRTRPIDIPLGSMYRYAVGFKHNVREDLTIGGGFTYIYEGALPIEDSGGVNGKYGGTTSISILSVYARWH
jgi:long-chain fatty acid transport protein